MALLATGAACTEADPTGTPPSTSTALSEQESAFCDAWNAALLTGDDSALIAALGDVPHELQGHATIVREGHGDGPQSPEEGKAVAEILDWTELRCPRGEQGDSQRHIAPPVGTDFEGLAFCGTIGLPPSPTDERSGMVLYGKAADPYEEPMLGLLWNPVGEGGHEGDDRGQPVTVRGQRGVAAAISVFQQTILPELGTVIAWTEGDRNFGLYGRQWSSGQAELVAIADQMEESEGRFNLPDDALPDGYREIFSGDPSVASIVINLSALYTVHYQGDDSGSLSLSGLQMSKDEFQAFQFFTLGVDRSEVAGQEALVGNAWNDDGPAVVTWREPDGLVVRIVGTGVPLEVAQKVAEESRELTAEEWASVVEAESQCPERRPPGLPPRPPSESPDTTRLD